MNTTCFLLHIMSMANNISSFEPTRATSPQVIALWSPLHEQYSIRIATDKPLVPKESKRPPVKRKSYEIDTGIPPSKDFKPPLHTSRLISLRSILLPPAELANRHPFKCFLDTPTSSPQIASCSSNQPIPTRAAYNRNRDQTYAMPYNNTAIPPPEEITGTASLPC